MCGHYLYWYQYNKHFFIETYMITICNNSYMWQTYSCCIRACWYNHTMLLINRSWLIDRDIKTSMTMNTCFTRKANIGYRSFCYQEIGPSDNGSTRHWRYSLHSIYFAKNTYYQVYVWFCIDAKKNQVKYVPINKYELLNIQACSYNVFRNTPSTQYLVVSCK